jgi:2-oxoglutarate ferredoxin oxidoreductase subunit gamma
MKIRIKMTRTNIRLAGLGGQGIILSGIILGRAASLYERKNAIQMQSYGAEARGGSCTSTVVISDKNIVCPTFEKADILVALSQKGYDTYIENLETNGLVFVDSHFVENLRNHAEKVTIEIPFTDLGERNFKRICANMVMLGALCRVTKIVSIDALLQAMIESVPKETQKLNSRAVEEGYRIGRTYLKNQDSG